MSIWDTQGTDRPFNTNEMATPIITNINILDWNRRLNTIDCAVNNTDITITLPQMRSNNNAGRISLERLDNTSNRVYIKPWAGQYLDGVIDNIIELSYQGQTIEIMSVEDKSMSPPGGIMKARSFLRPKFNLNGAIRSPVTAINATDVTNKQYVDDAVSSSIASSTEWRGGWFTQDFPTTGGSGPSGAIRAGDYWDVTEVLTITDVNSITKVIYPPNQLRAVSDGAINDWTQWTLGNDALLRSAGDYDNFTLKAEPSSADTLLIEDQSNSKNKAEITLDSLPISTATQTAITNAISDAQQWQGTWAGSGSLYPTLRASGSQIMAGDVFTVDATYTYPAVAGTTIYKATSLRALTNSPGQTPVNWANEGMPENKQEKVSAATLDNIATWNAAGNTKDSGVAISSIPAFNTNPKAIYLSSVGDDMTGNGTIAKPYRTFTKAEASVTGASIVYLEDVANYSDALTCTKDNVVFIGQGNLGNNKNTYASTITISSSVVRRSFQKIQFNSGASQSLIHTSNNGILNLEDCAFVSSNANVMTLGTNITINAFNYINSCDFTSSSGPILLANNTNNVFGTGTTTSGNTLISGLSVDPVSLTPGQLLVGTGLQAGTLFLARINATTMLINLPATASGSTTLYKAITWYMNNNNGLKINIGTGHLVFGYNNQLVTLSGNTTNYLPLDRPSVTTVTNVAGMLAQTYVTFGGIGCFTKVTSDTISSNNGLWQCIALPISSAANWQQVVQAATSGFTATEDTTTTSLDFNTVTTTSANHYVNSSISLLNSPSWLTTPYIVKDLELFTLSTTNSITQRIIGSNIQGFREAVKVSGSYVWNNWQQLDSKDTTPQSLVIDGLQTPPVSPNDQDSYIVLASPTGTWSAFTQGWIATYTLATDAWIQSSPVGKTITLQNPVNLQSINSYYFAGGSFKYAPTWSSPVIAGLFWQLYVPNTQFQPYTNHSVSLSRTSNIVTATDTSGNHNLAVGYSFTISSAVNATFNGTFTIVSILNSTQFTYAQASANASTVGILTTFTQQMGSGFTSAVFPASLTGATAITVAAGSYSSVATFPIYNNSAYVCNAFGINVGIGQNNILFTSTNMGWSPVTPSAGTGISDGNLYGYNYGTNANGDFANGLAGYQAGSVTMSGINPTTGFTPGVSTLIIGLTADTDTNTVMKITSAGNVAAGQSIKFPTVTVPNEYKGIVLTLEQLFRINGLTNIVTKGGLTDSFSLWGYDVTNSALIPMSQTGFIYAGGGNNTLNARQTLVIPPTCNQFYLFLVVSNAITGAMTNGLLIGKTKIRDIPVSNGTPVTNWTPNTISITADTTTPTLGTTPVKNSVIQRRNGQNLEWIWDYCSNVGSTGETAGNGSYIINLPQPLDLTTYGTVGIGAGGSNYIGTASFTNAINTTSVGWVEAISATQARVYFSPQGGANVGAFWGSTYQGFGNAAYRLGFTITMDYPVSGWSSNVAMSSNVPSGDLSLQFSNATVSANNSIINFPVLSGSLASNYSNGVLTAPSAGWYMWVGCLSANNTGHNLEMWKNGSIYRYLLNPQGTTNIRNFTSAIYLQSGETTNLYTSGAATTYTNVNANILFLSQNQTIATEPPVNIDLTSSNSPTLLTNPIANSTQTVIFNNSNIKGNISYNTTTGIGTILTNGRYNFSHFIEINANSSDYITALNLTISGTLYTLITAHMAQNYNVGINQSLAGSVSRYMSAGDTFTFQARPGGASTTVTSISHAEVMRIGG